MPSLNVKETVREIKRAAEIVGVFSKYGLEDLFDRTGLTKRFGIPMGLGSKDHHYATTAPEKLRLALEELGPAFVKLGQFLSTRPDILPYQYIAELEKLQDDVPPVPFHEVRTLVHAALDGTVDKLFRKFEREPVASASIAQVHLAVLADGTKVAVKVRRPDIEGKIAADTRIISELAKFLKNREFVDEVWRPTEIADQFERSLKGELDTRTEIANQKRFAENFAEATAVKIPKVYDEFSGDGVITMDYLEGVKLGKIIKSKGDRYPKKKIASIGAHAGFKMVFIDSFFHGDLHPGNLFWLEKTGQLGFIDFGIVGRLSETESRALTLMLGGIVSFDSEKVLLGAETLNIIDSSRQAEQLRTEVDVLLDKYRDAALKDVKVATLVQEIFGLMLKLRIRLPVSLIGLAKTLVIVEDMADKLDPDFSVFEFSKPYIEASIRRQTSLPKMLNKASNSLLRTGQLVENLPEDLGWILRNLKNNDFRLKVEHQKLPTLVDRLVRSSNRLAASIIVMGLIIGSSYVMPSFRSLGLIGYLVAFVIGLGILIGTIRKI